jgi:hypothetical protein
VVRTLQKEISGKKFDDTETHLTHLWNQWNQLKQQTDFYKNFLEKADPEINASLKTEGIALYEQVDRKKKKKVVSLSIFFL